MDDTIIEEYDAKLDGKQRCVIHGIPAFDRYHVTVFSSGKIEMSPRVLTSPDELSDNSRRMLYRSIKNFKKGKTGSAVDFGKYGKYLKDEE